MAGRTGLRILAALGGLGAATPATACDFCMLGQGISPYMTSSGEGATLDATYTHSGRIYDRTTAVGPPKQEGWLLYRLTGFYAVTPDVTVLVALPYAIKSSLDYDASSNQAPGQMVDGVGDATLTARYTLLTEHSLTSTLKLGVLGGAKLPTGRTDARGVDGRPVDRHVLPGTGSLDFLLGVNSAYAFAGSYQLTADLVYDRAGKGRWAGDPHRYGDGWNGSAEAYYKLYPPAALGTAYFAYTGASGESLGKETGVRNGDAYDPDLVNLSSGGTVLYWDLGLYATLEASTIVTVSYARAVYHRMNFSPDFDADPAEDYKLGFGVTRLF